MDVYGKQPDSETGKYFRRSVWGWRPLAGMVNLIAPALWSKVEYSQSNDGSGLGKRDSKALAKTLHKACDSGHAASLVQARRERLVAMPDLICGICAGTGKRAEPPKCGAGILPCNGCNSTGKVRPYECHYDVDAEDIREFAVFLEHCGGFEIW